MEKLNNLADISSFLNNRAESADKVIKETKDYLSKIGWNSDKALAKTKREGELLREGKKPSEVLEIIKKEFGDNYEQQKDYLKDIGYDIDKEVERARAKVDANNNGKIEKSEMENFTDSLNDYMDKNKKGRDDIPVTTRRR